MNVTSYENWKQWANCGSYTVLPFVMKKELEQQVIPSWEEAWKEAAPESFVLESGKGGRYTMLGLKPVSIIRGTVERAEVWEEDGHGSPRRIVLEKNALQAVQHWMLPYRSPRVEEAPKFIGGCVGFWGYDVARCIEHLPEQAANDLPVPDYSFAMYNEIWVVDQEKNDIYMAVHTALTHNLAQDEHALLEAYRSAERTANLMLDKWNKLIYASQTYDYRKRRELILEQSHSRGEGLTIDVEQLSDLKPAFRREDFEHAVDRIQSYISAGDVFQVNLSVRQSRPMHSSPEEVYEWLRIINPSPYMGLMRFGDFTLASASPELLVQLEQGVLRTRPIAGTRRRGANAREDQRLADELIHNEKERAEHVMLVDLERNDLGRISEYGSVKVDDFMVIEYYSHVMHIVSQIEGKIAQGKNAFDAIAATFPGGTITGAPKVRTMQIIEELEPVRRGPYTGAMGWIDYNGDMEFNIIIRTLVTAQGMGHVQAGAGIVIDSVPSQEYKESLNKAKAVWKAIEFSEQELSRA
ncbi:anthranilate synthase component I family protein [Paenibacillus sp. N1-5-1-14]|uniref:anthranilate synthase component I family protein n=1 Tax=Paenibacillus radicibacter TaxID=2972488 RepID=UPI0021599FD2|nr:anthranilate synthase component I family protein [Paenibacillus radicibacter]MCR8645841.1 anthranilate synthase component I family protein [Paenibacillus radicibacter]